MSNHCSNVFDYRSFSLFTPFSTPLKPYSTTLRPIFPFKRSRRTSSLPPSPLAAQSSSDIALIAITEHHDGSLLFRFGDASEVVKNDELVKEIESKAKWESNVVKVLDGDQEKEVIVKTIEGEYESGDGKLNELADGIRNVDIDSDVSQRETNVISDLRDYHAESSERLSNISEEVPSLQSDDKMNNSLEGVETTLDTGESTAQIDGDESLNPMTASILDNIPSRDKSADYGGPLLKDSNDETGDPSVSVKLETLKVSHIEVMDINKTYVEDELHKVETEDTSESDTEDLMPPATMRVSHVEFTGTANENVDEGLQDNIDEGTHIDEMPPTDPLGAEPTLDEVSQLLSSPGKLEATIQVSTTDELQEVSSNNRGENDTAYVMPVSRTLEAEPILEEEVSLLQSDPVEHKPTTQVSDIEGQDTVNQNLDDGILQVIDNDADESYIKDLAPSSHPLGAQPVPHEGVSLDEDPHLDDWILQAMDEGAGESYIRDVAPSSDSLEAQPVQDEGVSLDEDQNSDDGMLQVIDEDAGENYIEDLAPSSHPLEAQPVEDEGVTHNILEQCAETDALRSSILLKQGAHDSLLEADRIEGKLRGSELAEVSEDRAMVLAAVAKVRREEIYLTDYFLSSGAALLEHPSKALTGGDDAYFVAGSKWLGVANGVSRWSFEGTDPGVYAQELMKACEKIVLDSSSIPMSNPVELLCRGVKEINISGSSNILIANFNDQALHVANIGDTGFLIIRHGAIYKKSSPLLHEFHFALQLEECDDPLQLVEEYRIELDEGDIVVSATDGLFDNLYVQEIAMIVSKSLQTGMKPEEIANVLATRAQEVGRSAFVRSPFSDAAQAAGYTGYAGGKPDNVAVIVSLVEKRSNLFAE